MPDDTFIEDEETEQLLERADTLRGDVRDKILDIVMNQQKPWQQLSEMDQRQVISNANATARTLVRDAVRLIATKGERFIEGTLDQFTAKDEIKATVIISGHAAGRDHLFTGVKGRVLLVLLDDDELMGEQTEAAAQPDQPALPLEEAADKAVFDQTAAGAESAEPSDD